ncbi:hypothetical protein ACJJTC_000161 [Scirpophaga incertulas]
MTTLFNKIEMLIKREKTSPEKKKKDDSNKSSSEILTELFGAFNAAPPKIEDISVKKAKKSRKKHKKEKKKRSRSCSSSSDSNDSDYHKRKKRKKSKPRKRKERTPSTPRSRTPVLIKPDPDLKIKTEVNHIKTENATKVKKEDSDTKIDIKTELEAEQLTISVKTEDDIDASLIPMPESPNEDSQSKISKTETLLSENEKSKGRIQIKNLKFSTVFEETVKQAEEAARKKAEKYEEGEYTDSSSGSVKEVVTNSTFPKSSDPGGILKAAEETKISEEEKKESSKKSSTKTTETSLKSSKKDKERDKSKDRSSSKSHKRSPSGVKLADSEKKRLLEVARRNAINMLKNGAVPAGAAVLPPHTRNQVMAAIQSGGKSVDELTDFCKHLSKKEALGELSSVSSNDEDMSENEDTIAFHHPFLVKEKAPIVMNIRGGAPLPIKAGPVANKDELRLQFPVSSGSQHREKASEWVPVSPKEDSDANKVSIDKPVTIETIQKMSTFVFISKLL